MTIKAIETTYAGCRFRSRLEARWAVFFDHLGINWRYEPEGYQLPSGWYLPDFLISLGRGQVWIEVKPGNDDDPLPWPEARHIELATEDCPLYVTGDIPSEDDLRDRYICGSGRMCVTWGPSGGGDSGHIWCVCPYCGSLGIEFEGRAFRIGCCEGNRRADEDRVHNGDHPRLLGAYRAARQARFEHGESGSTQ